MSYTDEEWIELEDKEIVGEYYTLYKKKYKELCKMIRGDSKISNWTHEEVLEKLELAMEVYHHPNLMQIINNLKKEN